MLLTLRRIALRDTYTIGKLYINGVYECDTLEDKVRDLKKEPKIAGKTAIPYGSYIVTLRVKSPKFSKKKAYESIKGYLPRLLNVPHYDGILIHIGNTAEDSEGCILVGENKVVGKVINSTATFWKLYPKLKEASDNGETIIITIE